MEDSGAATGRRGRARGEDDGKRKTGTMEHLGGLVQTRWDGAGAAVLGAGESQRSAWSHQ